MTQITCNLTNPSVCYAHTELLEIADMFNGLVNGPGNGEEVIRWDVCVAVWSVFEPYRYQMRDAEPVKLEEHFS